MPRCYMVKKSSQRHDGPPPCSPTEASVAPPCYSPAEDDTAVTDPGPLEYEYGRTPTTQHTAAETEAAHDLLSLAQSLPPLPPPAIISIPEPPVPEPLPEPSQELFQGPIQEPIASFIPQPMLPPLSPPPVVPIYTYSIQPTNIFIITDEPPDPIYNTLPMQALASLPPFEYTVEPQLGYVAYQSMPDPPQTIPVACLAVPVPDPTIILQDFPVAPPPQPAVICQNAKLNEEIKCKARFHCTECGKRYATSSNLSRHKQTHRSLDSHAAKRCEDCGKAYVSMPALAMHVLTHRMGHVCGVCGKQFSRPWLLRGHLRSHTGERPYDCPISGCSKAFADRSNLRAHLQTHSTDKKFECLNCGKNFALKSYLTKHQETTCTREENNE